jgi:hypothetical protein
MVEVFKFGQMRVHSLCVDGREFLPKFLQRVSPRDLSNVKKESNTSRSNGPHRLCAIGFCCTRSWPWCCATVKIADPAQVPRYIPGCWLWPELLYASYYLHLCHEFFFSHFICFIRSIISLARSTNRKVPSINPFNNWHFSEMVLNE